MKFDSVVVLGDYHGPLGEVLTAMKLPAGALLAEAMAHLLCERRHVELRAHQVDMVLPVPFHWRRRFVRASDGPGILAQTLSRELGVPLVKSLVVRRRNTPPQRGLLPKARFRNVRGAFTARANYDLVGTRALVVDDTLTTGATCSEVALALKEVGAEEVHVAAIGRAQGANHT